MPQVALLVIAKQPLAGRVKTRLTPPLDPEQAAGLADAALRDTIDAVARTPAARRVLVFDGRADAWRRDGFDVVAQRGDDLGERLQSAFEDIDGPALLVGMDTPQLTPSLLHEAALAVADPRIDAVLGPTFDGGYWCVGFKGPIAGAFSGVTMSAHDTYSRQRQQFAKLRLRVDERPILRDFDTITDAHRVAAAAPHTRFAKALAAIG
jgi:rSAM/selenodomain-associated transferase 1